MSLVSWLNGRVALLITAVGITARSVKLEVRGRIPWSRFVSRCPPLISMARST